MKAITIKTKEEIEIMTEGGRRLAEVRDHLRTIVKPGVSAYEIDKEAERLIQEKGGKPSFKMVKDYQWTTCVNVNTGVVHGIPHKHLVFEEGDLVSVDVGMFYEGFHTDTSFTIGLNSDEEEFLNIGEKALHAGIASAKPGNRIYDISAAIEQVLFQNKLSPVWALVGHGIGKHLHEEPQIPCYTQGRREETEEIKEGMTLAIEIMYTKGNGKVKIDEDGWTISTEDDTISALYEETVAITKNGNKILTRAN